MPYLQKAKKMLRNIFPFVSVTHTRISKKSQSPEKVLLLYLGNVKLRLSIKLNKLIKMKNKEICRRRERERERESKTWFILTRNLKQIL